MSADDTCQPFTPPPEGLLSFFWAACRMRRSLPTDRMISAYHLIRAELAQVGYTAEDIAGEEEFALRIHPGMSEYRAEADKAAGEKLERAA